MVRVLPCGVWIVIVGTGGALVDPEWAGHGGSGRSCDLVVAVEELYF